MAATVLAKWYAPPSGRSSRSTLVSTTYFRSISFTDSATLCGSSRSSLPIGLPVSTAQKRQARVQMWPISMKVAVPRDQHSPMLGHMASSQTVCRRCSFTILRTSVKTCPVGMVTLSHSGFFSRTGTESLR